MPTGTQKQIKDFLSQDRLVMVGVSRDPKEFSRVLFKDMQQRGYEMIPVNPKMEEMEGLVCYSSVTAIPGPVEGVVVYTSPDVSEQIVRECAEAGVKRVWLPGPGSDMTVNKDAVAFCEENGIEVISGYCPYMFIKESPFFHRMHGGFLKLVGKYPKAD